MNNEITDEIRAQVLREYAQDKRAREQFGPDDLTISVSEIVEDANELDPPQPVIPDGTLCEGENRAGETICGYKFGDWLFDRHNKKGNAGVDPTAMMGVLTNLRPVRRLGPTQVAVDIPHLSEWPSTTECMTVRVEGGYDIEWIVLRITRDEARRMYEEAWDGKE